ncbi:hypothetical protein PMZ80_010508 [Knufia obscura]|uniref:ceramidase n=1 Tax=Knufia obscura TaxID=1635080 RepID=A0ABR0RAH8_9EURO|nr:hypothetical protein PMZ80_010508 [Knufia obscura]
MSHRQYTEPYTPPRWTIDLSLPPRDRYRQLARHYKNAIQGLTGLFDSLLRDVAVPENWIPTMNRLSRFLLRRVNDRSQTEELQGIAEESGIPMYLLVAFNVILDLLMGCTSGGVRSLEKGHPLSESKMLHFRTLDWSMDPLRQILVQLDFVRSNSNNPNSVLATSITYVGFTGVLTGVREGLSMSLNFRGLHDNSSRTAQFRFYFHHLLVLLGRRPSIATYLRKFLTGDHENLEALSRRRWKLGQKPRLKSNVHRPPQLAEIHEAMSAYHTTAAYLIFSDGDSTMSIDKDFRTAKMRRSRNFIATTNHDVVEHQEDQKENVVAARAVQSAARNAAGFAEFLDESEDRLQCISSRWKRLVARKQKERIRSGGSVSMEDVAARTCINQKQVIDWVSTYPTSNECTHFAVVLDPKAGTVVWCRAYPEPMTSEHERPQET